VTPEGIVWIATYGGGVSRLDSHQNVWTIYTTEDGLAHNKVRSITMAPDGSLWFGTEGGASRFDGSSWHQYTTQDGLVADSVYDVAIALDETIWLATVDGASHLEPSTNTWVTYTTNNGLVHDFVKNLAIGADGSVWFATTAGISQLVPAKEIGESVTWNTYSRYGDGKAAPIDSVDDIELAPDGSLWFAGYGGIAHFYPEIPQWIGYEGDSKYHGMAEQITTAIAVAPDGSVWIGTYDRGAIQLIWPPSDSSKKTWIVYDTRDGLLGNQVMSIEVAPDGAIWFGMRGGVSRCVFPDTR
jgi:ligand-binding sensor domain-containing protein